MVRWLDGEVGVVGGKLRRHVHGYERCTSCTHEWGPRLSVGHRKAELAQEKGGLLASFGQSIAGPRFIENDEVSLIHLTPNDECAS